MGEQGRRLPKVLFALAGLVLLGGLVFAFWVLEIRNSGEGQCMANIPRCTEPEQAAKRLALTGFGASALVAATLVLVVRAGRKRSGDRPGPEELSP